MGTPGMDLPEALRLFAQAGLDGAEVIWGEDFPASMQEGAGGRETAELGKLAGDLGLEVACLTPYMTGLNSLDAAERRRDLDRFGRCIEDAGVLGCPNIRVYAGSFMPGEEGVREEKWELLIGSLRVLAKDAEEAGVTLCVENHFNTMTVTAAETAELVKAVGSEAVGALYDQANLTFTHAEPHEEAIRVQSPFIRYVHVKDLLGVPGASPAARERPRQGPGLRRPGQGLRRLLRRERIARGPRRALEGRGRRRARLDGYTAPPARGRL